MGSWVGIGDGSRAAYATFYDALGAPIEPRLNVASDGVNIFTLLWSDVTLPAAYYPLLVFSYGDFAAPQDYDVAFAEWSAIAWDESAETPGGGADSNPGSWVELGDGSRAAYATFYDAAGFPIEPRLNVPSDGVKVFVLLWADVTLPAGYYPLLTFSYGDFAAPQDYDVAFAQWSRTTWDGSAVTPGGSGGGGGGGGGGTGPPDTRDLKPPAVALRLTRRADGVAASPDLVRLVPGESRSVGFDCFTGDVLPRGAVIASITDPTGLSGEFSASKLGTNGQYANFLVGIGVGTPIGSSQWLSTDMVNSNDDGSVTKLTARIMAVSLHP